MQVMQNHYRTIERLMEDIENIVVIKNKRNLWKDAGYIICDCNNKFILNAQDAFQVEKKDFTVLNLL